MNKHERVTHPKRSSCWFSSVELRRSVLACNVLPISKQGNQQNRAMMLNSKVVDYINYILRAAEFKNCDLSLIHI